MGDEENWELEPLEVETFLLGGPLDDEANRMLTELKYGPEAEEIFWLWLAKQMSAADYEVARRQPLPMLQQVYAAGWHQFFIDFGLLQKRWWNRALAEAGRKRPRGWVVGIYSITREPKYLLDPAAFLHLSPSYES